MPTLELPGRLLFLTEDPALVQAQLAGQALTRAGAGTLRDDISTDEITPVPILTHYDDALGRYPYTGFRSRGVRPIGVGAIREGIGKSNALFRVLPAWARQSGSAESTFVVDPAPSRSEDLAKVCSSWRSFAGER